LKIEDIDNMVLDPATLTWIAEKVAEGVIYAFAHHMAGVALNKFMSKIEDDFREETNGHLTKQQLIEAAYYGMFLAMRNDKNIHKHQVINWLNYNISDEPFSHSMTYDQISYEIYQNYFNELPLKKVMSYYKSST